MTADAILADLQTLASPQKAAHLSRFFKTGPGEYGEGDLFLGIPVPATRNVAKKHRFAPLAELHQLLQSPWHEARLCALLILVLQMQRAPADSPLREEIFRFYLAHTRRCNNWDLVDLSCPYLVGAYLLDKPREVLYVLADSSNLWEQRIALVSTLPLIRHDDFTDILALSVRLMSHPHDLIHKAIGWMLREVGKCHRPTLTSFLATYKRQLPRTALRYAIEHYPEEERKAWLAKD